MSFPTNTKSNTRPKYLFDLFSEIGDITCSFSPKGFESSSIELKRDMVFSGVFEEFNVSDLTFYGSKEKRLLRDLRELKGFFAKCSLQVSYLDRTTDKYVAFADKFVLDFSTFNEVKTGFSRNAVRINTKITGFAKKIKERKKTNIDLSKTVTLGGYQIQLRDHWAAAPPYIKNTMFIPEISEKLTGSFLEPFNPAVVTVPDNVIPQLTILSSDFNELRSQSQTLLSGGGVNPDASNAIYFESEAERDLLLNGDLLFLGNSSVFGSGVDLELRYAIINSNGSTIDSDVLIESKSILILNSYVYNFSDYAITIPIGKSLVLYFKVATSSKTVGGYFYEDGFTITQVEVSSPEKYIETIPIQEAFERNFQHILDEQYPIYTEFFGRTDVVYNADGDKYLTENKERFASLFNGLSVRGLSISDINNSIATNLTDLFNAANVRWNIGFGEETIGGLNKIRLEEKAHFYKDEAGLDYSDRIEDIEIEDEALPDLAYSNIESGYKTSDYELINGRGEYNTKSERTSLLPLDNTFDNVSKISGDTMSLVKFLNDPIVPDGVNQSSGTKDLKGDSDIFIFKTYDRGLVIPYSWDIEQQQNIQVLDNTSLFGTTSFNLFFTPTRMLLRHNYELAAGLEKVKNSYLRFQTSDKLQNLRTTNGVDDITENQDILVQDLGDPKWKAKQYIVTLPFYEADFEPLKENRYKLIKLSDTKQGWILSAKYKIIKKQLQLNILPKYE